MTVLIASFHIFDSLFSFICEIIIHQDKNALSIAPFCLITSPFQVSPLHILLMSDVMSFNQLWVHSDQCTANRPASEASYLRTIGGCSQVPPSVNTRSSGPNGQSEAFISSHPQVTAANHKCKFNCSGKSRSVNHYHDLHIPSSLYCQLKYHMIHFSELYIIFLIQ